MGSRDLQSVLLLGVAAALYFYFRYSLSAAGGAVVYGSSDVAAPATATATPSAPQSFTAAAPSGGVANLIESAFNQVFPMQIDDAGKAFIQAQEGLSLTSYPDATGYSIGYGHFIQPVDAANYGLVSGPGVSIDQALADQLLQDDLLAVENTINQNVAVVLSQNQFNALCDFVYNVGSGNFLKSTLLRNLNQGDYAGAENEFQKWVLTQGRASSALAQRRVAEADLFATA